MVDYVVCVGSGRTLLRDQYSRFHSLNFIDDKYSYVFLKTIDFAIQFYYSNSTELQMKSVYKIAIQPTLIAKETIANSGSL